MRSSRKRAFQAVFSAKRSVSRPDPNPIVGEGAPKSTGGIFDAAALCDAIGIMFDVDKPRDRYMHGWGDKCTDAMMILCSWNLTLMDIHGYPVTLTFD